MRAGELHLEIVHVAMPTVQRVMQSPTCFCITSQDCGQCVYKQAAKSRCMHALAISLGSKGISPEARGYLCCSQHTSGGLESKACSMLRQTIHMLCLWKGDIKRDALWAIGLAVCVALEGFLPPPFRIALLQSWHLALDCCDLWQ